MEQNETVERIRSCMFMESACAAVYHLLALNFSKESELWSQLAMDEEAHAEIIARGMKFTEPEYFTDFEAPADLKDIKKTIDYAAEFKKLLVKDQVSLKGAFEKVIDLLELKNAGYQNDLIGKEKEERIRRVFERIYEIDSSNVSLVRAVMSKYDFSKAAG